jgi:hypothetical protein
MLKCLILTLSMYISVRILVRSYSLESVKIARDATVIVTLTDNTRYDYDAKLRLWRAL